MCGIAGIFTEETQDNIKKALNNMLLSLAHRGPDFQESVLFEKGGFAHSRLSIIDKSAASHQPFSSPDGRYVLTYNGELYNFKALRKQLSGFYEFQTESDTEVVLAAYIKWQEKCLSHFNGMFAFAVYDTHKKMLFAARDRLGIKPLYYSHTKTSFMFASEFKAIANSPGFKKTLNHKAVNMYLTLDYIPAPLSIDEQIMKLEPGHFLIYHNHQLHCERYWDLDPCNDVSKRSDDEEVEQLDHLLHASVKARLMSDVPLGVFLSGGLDSSLITAIAKHYKPDLKTFSIHFNEQSFDESVFSKYGADYLKTTHHAECFSPETFQRCFEDVFRMMDEPFADPSFFPTTYLSQITKRQVTVALGGDGADELFAGYPTSLAHKLCHMFPYLDTRLLKGVFNCLPSNNKNFSLKFKVAQFLKGQGYAAPVRHMYWMGSCSRAQKHKIIQTTMEYSNELEHLFQSCAKGFDSIDTLNQLLYVDLKQYLTNDILVKVDRASMSQSLEVRVPFLDHCIVEWAFALPSHKKLKGYTSKYILKHLAKRYLPKRISHRSKKGFGLPLADWMKGPLKEEVQETVLTMPKESCFNKAYLKEIFSTLNSNRYIDYKMLWSIYVLQKWSQQHGYVI